jgi:hypothetical protein
MRYLTYYSHLHSLWRIHIKVTKYKLTNEILSIHCKQIYRFKHINSHTTHNLKWFTPRMGATSTRTVVILPWEGYNSSILCTQLQTLFSLCRSLRTQLRSLYNLLSTRINVQQQRLTIHK